MARLVSQGPGVEVLRGWLFHLGVWCAAALALGYLLPSPARPNSSRFGVWERGWDGPTALCFRYCFCCFSGSHQWLVRVSVGHLSVQVLALSVHMRVLWGPSQERAQMCSAPLSLPQPPICCNCTSLLGGRLTDTWVEQWKKECWCRRKSFATSRWNLKKMVDALFVTPDT